MIKQFFNAGPWKTLPANCSCSERSQDGFYHAFWQLRLLGHALWFNSSSANFSKIYYIDETLSDLPLIFVLIDDIFDASNGVKYLGYWVGVSPLPEKVQVIKDFEKKVKLLLSC